MKNEILALAVILMPLSARAQRVAIGELYSLVPAEQPAVIAPRPHDHAADIAGKGKGRNPCSAHLRFDLPSNSKEGPLAVAEVQEVVRATCVAFGRCAAEAKFQVVAAATVGELTRGKFDRTWLRNTLTHNIERHDHNHSNPKVKLAYVSIEESMTLERLAAALTSAQRPIKRS